MVRPESIKVEDDIVTVEWDVKLKRMPDGYPTGGDYHKGKIRVENGARRTVQREHLFHEIMHKVWEKAELDKDYSTKTEEYIITSLSGWLLDALRDNPELQDFLFSE